MQLLTNKSYKTAKGEKKGITTYISYLAPYTQNSKGINLCAGASLGCAEACLFKSGNARYNAIQVARMRRSDWFVNDRVDFMNALLIQVSKIVRKHEKMDSAVRYKKNGEINYFKDIAIRLNGTTDIPYDKLKYSDGLTIFEKFPNVQFYDYTKNIKVLERLAKKPLANYHVTFSRSESNEKEVNKAIELGFNVAVVFEELPTTYKGLEVINGDETDLRFKDPKNVIVGLTYKRASVKGGKEVNDNSLKTGFVVTKKELEMAF